MFIYLLRNFIYIHTFHKAHCLPYLYTQTTIGWNYCMQRARTDHQSCASELRHQYIIFLGGRYRRVPITRRQKDVCREIFRSCRK